MAAKMYPQAVALLEKRITDKPTDVEAHYQLGICYINTGNYSGADERFASAVALESEYGYKIGGEYGRVGSESLSKGQTSQAQNLFQKAIQYQPNLRASIAKEVFSQGKNYFNQGQFGSADRRFLVAITFDISLRRSVCDMYFNLGKAADETRCVPFYQRTKKYCSSHNKEIGQRLLEISKTKKQETEVQKWRKEAFNFIEVPPDYKIYGPGVHYLPPLKAGETLDHWIRFPDRGWTNYYLSSVDYGYKLIYYDGEVIKDGKDVVYPNKAIDKLKILAITDQPGIKLEVK